MNVKTLIPFLCAAFCLQNAAFAEVKIQETEKEVIFKMNITPNSGAMLIAVKEGSSLDNANIYAMEYENSDANGEAVFAFVMDDEKNTTADGKYDVYIKEDEKKVEIKSMVYATVETRTNFLREIRGVSDVSELSAILQNTDNDYEIDGDNDIVLAAIGCDMSSYDSTADAIMYEYLSSLENGLSGISIADFARGYELAQAVVQINASDEGAAAKVLEEINLSFENEEYSAKTNEEKAYISKYIFQNKDYNSVADMQTAYNQACALWIVNNVRVDYVENTLEKYADLLGLTSSSEYIKYKAVSVKNTVNTTIVAKLKASKAESESSLISVIGQAVTAYNESQSTDSSSSGFSGGGGGGSNSGSYSSYAIPSSQGGYAFNDLEQAPWAAAAIEKLKEKNIVSGDENGNFRPNDPLKREEFIKMIVDLRGIYDETAECDFSDVKKGKWYYPYIASAYKNGLVSGISDDIAGVGELLTRQDMVVMAKRAAEGFRELTYTRDMIEFSDYDSIADYAKDAVEIMYRANIVNGEGENKFNPEGTATRAQGALIIYNIFVE